ncbi:Hypothetical predicted protein [Mytilus galloprovincialis]|uniref:Tetraspanin n=1 Tax=Mytilus galloprovincialis TaxID=29158 RepID=A0A8B6DGD0_MYTGA|nr:Hypothetical predicted protein [Mytilus galloprovincialis]
MSFIGEESIAKAGRCVIVWLNSMFVVIGVVMVAIGVILKSPSDVGFIKAAENAIKIALNAVLKGTYLTNYSISSFNMSDLFSGISTGMIVGGILILFLSFFGCCGGCFKMSKLLIVYSISVGVFLVVELIVVILMYAAPSTIQGSIKDLFKQTMEDFRGIQGENIASLGWMFVIYEFECCGVNSYKDFHNFAPQWNRYPIANGTNITAPITCCKSLITDGDISCATEKGLNIYEQGCFEAIWDKVLGKPLYAGLGFTSMFVFQAVLIIFSAILSKTITDEARIEPIYG